MFRALVIGVAVLVTGCRDQALAELEEIKDDVCACKTPACGELAMKRVPQDEARSNHRSQRIARELLDCLAKLYAGERPTTDPDADQPLADPMATSPGSAAPASGGTP